MKKLEILDLPSAVSALVSECELTGKRTLFARSGRPVAILLSHDEYLALRETIEIANDERLRQRVAAAEERAQRGGLLLPEDLFGE